MATFDMQQKAVVWYSFQVEAETLDEAKQKALAGEGDEFWQVEDSQEFLQVFCLADDLAHEFGDDAKKGNEK